MNDDSTHDATPGDAATALAAAPHSALAAKIGRYEVRRVLGQGGMGMVLAAWDPQLERLVAVKLVKGQSDDGAQRLVREARAMAKLRHPHVITVHDAGIVDGEVFVVMELVDGETLADWFAKRPPWREVLARGRRAGEGLVAAHAIGLVHRDFKPANVLCGSDGRVVVADFGLARHAPGDAAAVSAITSAGGIVGTPAYMAPEQHLGEEVGPAADQFALAATLYEGLFGTRPYGGNTLAALISELLSGNIRPPPEGSDVPEAVRAVVVRGLQRVAADRYPSVAIMLEALAEAETPAVSSAPIWPRWPWIAAGVGFVAIAGLVMSMIGSTAKQQRAAGDAAIAKRAPVSPGSIDAALPAPAAPKGDIPADKLTRWDVIADQPIIDARAQAWMPDATFVSVIAVGAKPDGTADLTAGAFVQYLYIAPSRDETTDPRTNHMCSRAIWFKDGALSESENTPVECTAPTWGPPRCGPREIWARAIADGADPAKLAHLEYPAPPYGKVLRWLFQSKSLTKVYADDC